MQLPFEAQLITLLNCPDLAYPPVHQPGVIEFTAADPHDDGLPVAAPVGEAAIVPIYPLNATVLRS